MKDSTHERKFLIDQLHEMFDLDEDQAQKLEEGTPIREVLEDFDEVTLLDLCTETSCEFDINTDPDEWLELFRKEDFNLNHLVSDILVFKL